MRVLIAGGPADFVNQRIKLNLSKAGLEVAAHWEYKRTPPRQIPVGISAVILLTDMCGHDLSNRARELARAESIPLCMTVRKWAVMQQQLIECGLFKPKLILPANPLDLKGKSYEEVMDHLCTAVEVLNQEHGITRIVYENGKLSVDC
jgi:hypothetical protein